MVRVVIIYYWLRPKGSYQVFKTEVYVGSTREIELDSYRSVSYGNWTHVAVVIDQTSDTVSIHKW